MQEQQLEEESKVSNSECNSGNYEFCNFSLPLSAQDFGLLRPQRSVTIGHFGCTCSNFFSGEEDNYSRCQLCILTEWSWVTCSICGNENLECSCVENTLNIENRRAYYELRNNLFSPHNLPSQFLNLNYPFGISSNVENE